jgi:inorganic pyrophosphatase
MSGPKAVRPCHRGRVAQWQHARNAFQPGMLPRTELMTDPLSPSIASPTVEVLIETPRGSFAKRDVRGAVEFLSPLPCPFNYGCVPALAAADGDALDAIVLGPRLQVGQRLQIIVRATVVFIDGGLQDDKLICASFEPSVVQRCLVLGFFHFYAFCKNLANRARGKSGLTRCLGWRDGALATAKLPL